jgi:hypothetical protein
VSPSYGVPSGPLIVPVQRVRLPSCGNALMPGVEDIISCINSVWRLGALVEKAPEEEEEGETYRLATAELETSLILLLVECVVVVLVMVAEDVLRCLLGYFEVK